MNRLQTFVLCVACSASFGVAAQWQWLDKDARKVYSDRPPPAEIPEKNILKRPGGLKAKAAEPVAATPVSRLAASAPRSAASGIRLSGKDAELEAKKKEVEAQEAAKQKAEDDKLKLAQAENCDRARKAKTGLDSGQRIQTQNDKGEREFMSDEARAAENRRLQGVLKDCS